MKFAVWPSMNDPWHETLAIAPNDHDGYIVTVAIVAKD
jgi:hypothetical protein